MSYPNLAGSPYAYTYVIGKPLSIIEAYQYKEVNPNSGLYIFNSKDPNNPVYPDDLYALKKQVLSFMAAPKIPFLLKIGNWISFFNS